MYARHIHPLLVEALQDTPVVHSAAKRDPAGFIDGLEGPVVLDEVQRAPEIFLSLPNYLIYYSY